MSTVQDIFTDIYARKVWGDGSGGGSVHSGPYIDYVNQAIAKYKPRSILDIGCGDLVVASQFHLQGAEYIGWDAATFDVVADQMKGMATVHMGVDALTEPIPEVDMILCKEVMQHLPNEYVLKLLERTKDCPIRIICNSAKGDGLNDDIPIGGFRPIDLNGWCEVSVQDNLRFGPNDQYIVHLL